MLLFDQKITKMNKILRIFSNNGFYTVIAGLIKAQLLCGATLPVCHNGYKSRADCRAAP
jgi:hypothetical protein